VIAAFQRVDAEVEGEVDLDADIDADIDIDIDIDGVSLVPRASSCETSYRST
jgi:hypothetical protein